jgi:hypothetical protein
MADTKGGISRKGQELDCAHHGSELIISELTGAEALLVDQPKRLAKRASC